MVEAQKSVSPFQGIVDLGDGLTPIDVWQGIHANARYSQSVPDTEDGGEQQGNLDASDRLMLRQLEVAQYPAERWIKLCDSVGWTPLGAVALSWCNGAELAHVLDRWQCGTLPPLDDALLIRTASFVNPALLPSPHISSLIEAAKSLAGVWLLVVACHFQKVAITIDIPPEQMKRLNAHVKKWLRS